MRRLPALADLPPLSYLRNGESIPRGRKTTVSKLCKIAGVPYRATVANERPVIVRYGREQCRARHVDVVGVRVRDLDSRVAALRALEALAFSFFDHAARHCVCHRGYFGPPRKRRG